MWKHRQILRVLLAIGTKRAANIWQHPNVQSAAPPEFSFLRAFTQDDAGLDFPNSLKKMDACIQKKGHKPESFCCVPTDSICPQRQLMKGRRNVEEGWIFLNPVLRSPIPFRLQQQTQLCLGICKILLVFRQDQLLMSWSINAVLTQESALSNLSRGSLNEQLLHLQVEALL